MKQRREEIAEARAHQRRLGHRSPATTGIYLQALRADENPYAEDLVKALGVEG